MQDSEGPYIVDSGSAHIGCSYSAEQYTAGSDSEQYAPTTSSCSRSEASQGIRPPCIGIWMHDVTTKAAAAYDGLSAIPNHSADCYSTSRSVQNLTTAMDEVIAETQVAKKKSAFLHCSNGKEPTKNTACWPPGWQEVALTTDPTAAAN